MNRFDIETEFRKLQDYICGELELLDGKSKFNEDAWTREWHNTYWDIIKEMKEN